MDDTSQPKKNSEKMLPRIDTIAKRVGLWSGAALALCAALSLIIPYIGFLLLFVALIAGLVLAIELTGDHSFLGTSVGLFGKPDGPVFCIQIAIGCLSLGAVMIGTGTLSLLAQADDTPLPFTENYMLAAALYFTAALAWGSCFPIVLHNCWITPLILRVNEIRDPQNDAPSEENM